MSAPFKLPVRVELGNNTFYEVWDQDNIVVAGDLNEDEAIYIAAALNARARRESQQSPIIPEGHTRPPAPCED